MNSISARLGRGSRVSRKTRIKVFSLNNSGENLCAWSRESWRKKPFGEEDQESDLDVLYLRHLWDIHVETLTKNLDIESRVQERGLG